MRSGVFEPPFGGLRGKVGALSIPRWKARDRLRISDKCEKVIAEELQAEISPIQRFVKGVHHFDATFEVEGLVFPPTSMYR